MELCVVCLLIPQNYIWAVKKISSDFSDFVRWIIIALEARILTVASL